MPRDSSWHEMKAHTNRITCVGADEARGLVRTTHFSLALTLWLSLTLSLSLTLWLSGSGTLALESLVVTHTCFVCLKMQ